MYYPSLQEFLPQPQNCEEDSVGPLLRLVKEDRADGQENAVRTLGLLGRDPKNVDHMLHAGVCSALAKLLKDGGPMRAQSVAAWAVAELASNHPTCQDVFAENNVIHLLVGHLAFKTVQEHNKYIIPSSKVMSLHSVVLATTNMMRMASSKSSKPIATATNGDVPPWKPHQSFEIGAKGRESEDPATKTKMKAMAAKALWQLAKKNPAICKSITESCTLLCFAVLLKKGSGGVVVIQLCCCIFLTGHRSAFSDCFSKWVS